MSKEYEKLMREAQKKKVKLTQSSAKKIRNLYKEVCDDLVAYSSKSNGFNKVYYNDYMKYVKSRVKELDNKILELTKANTTTAGQIAAGVHGDYFNNIGKDFDLDIPNDILMDFFSIPDDVLLRILQGDLYKDGVSLSNRIWKGSQHTVKDINYIITKGIAMKKPYTEIMKDVEIFLNPSAIKSWEWRNVYPGVSKKVDYNAQRLVRTSINHAFYNSNIESCKKNPFVDGVKWNLSGAHYSRQVERFGEDICDEYTSSDNYGLGPGIFPKDKVPIPHPNCLCYQTAHITKSYNEIGKELGAWINGDKNSKLDKWYKAS